MNLFPKVKFCGLSNYDDVALACEQQAYWAGFIFVKGSSRYIKIEESKSIISLLQPETKQIFKITLKRNTNNRGFFSFCVLFRD